MLHFEGNELGVDRAEGKPITKEYRLVQRDKLFYYKANPDK